MGARVQLPARKLLGLRRANAICPGSCRPALADISVGIACSPFRAAEALLRLVRHVTLRWGPRIWRTLDGRTHRRQALEEELFVAEDLPRLRLRDPLLRLLLQGGRPGGGQLLLPTLVGCGPRHRTYRERTKDVPERTRKCRRMLNRLQSHDIS